MHWLHLIGLTHGSAEQIGSLRWFAAGGKLPTAEEERRIVVEQAKLVLATSPWNLTAGIFAALLMAGVLFWAADDSLSRTVPWIWWLLLSLGLLRGAVLAARFTARGGPDDEVFREVKRLTVNGVFCAALYGSTSWLMLPTPNQHAESFLMIATAMVFMGGASAQANYLPLMNAFAIPATATFSLGLLRLWDPYHIALAAAFPILAFVIHSAGKTQREAVRAVLLLRIRTEVLLREKIEQQALTDRARNEAEHARHEAERAREEAEAAREEAERANQSKTTFLAAAGHDLRQPMHALVQYHGQLVRRNVDPELTLTIGRAGKAIEAMQELLDSILEVSKLMMGAVRANIQAIELATVLERVEVQAGPLAEDKGLRLTIGASEGIVVKTDAVLLERILRNLVINAIRYTDVGRVIVRPRMRGRNVSVQVWDTGIGVAKEEQGRIFEAFYQIANQARNRRKGLGLGLSLVQQLCELMHHRVTVRSRVGRGSLFSVDIELAEKRPSSAPIEAGTAVQDYLRGAFVLLVDDDTISRDATEQTLKTFGCRVVSASGSQDALERLQGQEFMPQLIVSDYRLEGETGLTAIQAIIDNQKALFGDEFDIPSVIVSGDTAPEILQEVREAGGHLLHKPVKVDTLYRTLNDMLRESAHEVN
jgi:signal transduction histidine kinase/CheY-like chemotaxis protein